jgi:hypothetical protein
MGVTDDLCEAGAVSRHALAPSIARDWSVQAGDLTWDALEPTGRYICVDINCAETPEDNIGP